MFVQMYFLTRGGNFIFSVLTEHQDSCTYEKVQVPHVYFKDSWRSQRLLLPEDWHVSISLFQFIISVLRGLGFLTTSHCKMFLCVCTVLNERLGNTAKWLALALIHTVQGQLSLKLTACSTLRKIQPLVLCELCGILQ